MDTSAEQIWQDLKTVGLIGLTERGYALAAYLRGHGVTTVCFDFDGAGRQRSAHAGFVTTSSIAGVVMHLPAEKLVWVALDDAGQLETAARRLAELMGSGAVAIIAPIGEADKRKMLNLLENSGLCVVFVDWHDKQGYLLGRQPAFDLLRHFFEKCGFGLVSQPSTE